MGQLGLLFFPPLPHRDFLPLRFAAESRAYYILLHPRPLLSKGTTAVGPVDQSLPSPRSDSDSDRSVEATEVRRGRGSMELELKAMAGPLEGMVAKALRLGRVACYGYLTYQCIKVDVYLDIIKASATCRCTLQ